MLSSPVIVDHTTIIDRSGLHGETLIRTLIQVGKAEGGTFYISAPSLPCYAERKTYR